MLRPVDFLIQKYASLQKYKKIKGLSLSLPKRMQNFALVGKTKNNFLTFSFRVQKQACRWLRA